MSYIEQLAQIWKNMNRMIEAGKCVSVTWEGVHMGLGDLWQNVAVPAEWEVEEFGLGNYPYKAFVHIQGVKFYALMTQEQYDKWQSSSE
jgi:hypothetical protein